MNYLEEFLANIRVSSHPYAGFVPLKYGFHSTRIRVLSHLDPLQSLMNTGLAGS